MKTVKDEMGTSEAFNSIQQEVFLNLAITVDRMMRRHTEFMQQFGISPKQFNILRILRRAGSDGLPVMEIGNRIIEKSPDISRIVDRLVALKLVKRKRQRQDRRVVIISISTEGLNLLAEIDPLVENAVDTMFSVVSEEKLQTLTDLLNEVRDAVYSV